LRAVRVLLADDHALVRAGIRALSNTIEGVEVIAEAGDGREALRLISELQPDIVLLDITMPGMSGLELLEETTRKFPGIRVIILTVHNAGEYAMRALRAGAAGYLPKSAAADELQVAIDIVSRGETYISGEVSRNTLIEFSKSNNEQAHPIASLTPRQREILTLVAEGLSTKAIGRRLNISVKTVESHRAQLMDRLDIHDVAGLVRYAIKMGLVKVE
jgi:DNA-binding NarL/FixJ family response regulator